jgi:Skp family chaperone for outer membrane proteins
MKTKLLLAVAMVAAIPAAASAQRAPAASIVVVDTDRILRDCTACVAARNALQAQQTSGNQRAVALGVASSVQGQPAALDREAQEIQNAINALPQGRQPDAALQGRIQNFRQRQQSAVQELQTLQANLQSTQQHVIQQLTQRLATIYTQVMNSRGANLVLSTDARLAHSPALEVTNEVLAALNQQLPAVSVTPLPGQQQQQQPRPGGR